MTKLSTHQVTSSVLLMTLLTHGRKDGGTDIADVMAAARAAAGGRDAIDADDPHYEVKISVAGHEVEFQEFVDHVNANLDKHLAEEAGRILLAPIRDQILVLEQQLDELHRSVTRIVHDALGLTSSISG